MTTGTTVKTGTAITRTSREAAWITTIVLLLIGKYCDRNSIVLSTSDSIEIAGGISALIMYGAAHLKASRIARLADALADRLEDRIRGGPQDSPPQTPSPDERPGR